MKAMVVHKRIEVTWRWVGQFNEHCETFRYVGPECADYVKAVVMSDTWDDDTICVDAVIHNVDDILVESICFDGIVW